MSQVTLSASTTRAEGTRNSRRLRAAGTIPAVVYGKGTEPFSVGVDAKEFRTAVSGDQGLNTLIHLDANGTTYTVLAREIQKHKTRGTVAHIDFQVIDPNEPVIADVALKVIGDAVEVRHADWEVDQQLFRIAVKARPSDIPTIINVDISELRPGQAIHIRDLVLPAGVEAAGDVSANVVNTHAGRAAKQAGNANA